MKLNFTSLLYFQRTAEMQHLTNAAESLHVTQPALSRMISGIEKELGVALFERKGRNIKLTRDGEILLKHAKSFLAELDQLKTDLNESKNLQQMTVTLNIESAAQLIPVFLMKFRQEHPEAILDIRNRSLHHLHSQETDLTLFSSNEPIDSPHTVTLFKENLIVIMPKDSTYANGSRLSLSDLATAKFIAPPKGMWLRKTIDDLCASAGFEANVVMESDNPNTVREFIHAGLGIAVIPQLTWYAARGEHIKMAFLTDDKCYRHLNLSWHTDSQLSLVAVLLQEYIIDNFWEFVQNAASYNSPLL